MDWQPNSSIKAIPAWTSEDTRIGDAVLDFDDDESERPSPVECPICHGPMVIDDAVSGRALSDAKARGGDFEVFVQKKPDGIECHFCNACGVAFYAPPPADETGGTR